MRKECCGSCGTTEGTLEHGVGAYYSRLGRVIISAGVRCSPCKRVAKAKIAWAARTGRLA